MTTCRFAELADLPAMVALGRQMHVQSRYGWMQYRASQVWKYLETTIPSKQCCVIVALATTATEAAVCGVLVATARQFPFSFDFVAQVDYLYLVPSQRGTLTAMKMLTAFKRWANNREVTEILIPNNFGTGQAYTDKLFTKLGMTAVGNMHTLWMQRK